MASQQPALDAFLEYIDRIVNDREVANQLRYIFLYAGQPAPDEPLDVAKAELMLLLSQLIEERAEPRPPSLTVVDP